MALLEIWNTNREELLGYRIDQIAAIAGDGKLTDGSDCATELRQFLSKVSLEQLETYASYCVENAFESNGLVLQDVVNEVGRRLGYKVEFGRYRGTSGSIGFDGVWRGGNWSIVIEVKTTTSYSIEISKIVDYRASLIATEQIDTNSSILVVVGRGETEGLEAQIRGSRSAWDIRLISVESLMKLAAVKENSASAVVVGQVHDILRPFEYTRVDQIISMIFDISVDSELDDDVSDSISPEDSNEKTQRTHEVTPREIIEAKRDQSVEGYGAISGHDFIRVQRTLFLSEDESIGICVVVSKNHGKGYWYRFDPYWLEFLEEKNSGFYIVSGTDTNIAYAIPVEVMRDNIENLNRTTLKNGKSYWHIHVEASDTGEMKMLRSGGRQAISLEEFKIQFS